MFGKVLGNRSIGWLFVLFYLLPAAAQVEPCGHWPYDLPTLPGQLRFSSDTWPGNDSSPADFDRDGMISVLDLVNQLDCLPGYNNGLVTTYFGLADGTIIDQETTWPDFPGLESARTPVMVRMTETIEHVDNVSRFMDSGMRQHFAAVMTGYLFVPETAEYTLQLFAISGARLVLDGVQRMHVVGNPNVKSTTLDLNYGLHEIRLEYYNNRGNGRVSLGWSSDGSIIGPSIQSISWDHLYHLPQVTHPDSTVEPELQIFPETGSRTANQNVEVSAWGMAPGGNIRIYANGVEQPIDNGLMVANLDLDPGVNHFTFRVVDGDGNIKDFPWTIYCDAEIALNTGLSASLSAREWSNSRLPDAEDFHLFARTSHPGTQMSDVNRVTTIGGVRLTSDTHAALEGVIEISQAGDYTFEINRNGAVIINGQTICAINHDYLGQNNRSGTIFLDVGRHHYRVNAGQTFQGPEIRVTWRFNGGPSSEVPDNIFFRGPTHGAQVPALADSATGNRVGPGQVGEYLFKPGAEFEDSSGNNLHLVPDSRAIPRAGGGLSYRVPGGASSEKAGARMFHEAALSDAFSLEVDIIPEHDLNSGGDRELASLSGSGGSFETRLYINRNDLRFNMDGTVLSANNVVNAGRRLHIMATWNGTWMRMYVNGVTYEQRASETATQWRKDGTFNIAEPFKRGRAGSINDQAFIGTFLGAAFYNRTLSATQAARNRSANLLITPTPGSAALPAATELIPGGTTAQDLDEAHHVLNRLTFGPTPESLHRILTIGVDSWIDEQLDPGSIDDSKIEALLAGDMFFPGHVDADFRAWTLMRMASSKRQLNEVMTWFWENHFNTDLTKVDYLEEEVAENSRFRQHALGNFKDLLLASAIHFPMTVYLDNNTNIVGAENENYAREIMELHCLGVNNGYTIDDIIAVARAFTGWTVRDGDFYFDPGLHDYGPKEFLGLSVPPGGGISDGMAVIDHLVSLPGTAWFISWKLCQVFIDDDPPGDIVDAATQAFIDSGGEITDTLRAIFNHSRFRTDLAYRAQKTKTPLEFAISLSRAMEAHIVPYSLTLPMADMGMELHNFADPTGYAEEGVFWIDPTSLLKRWNLVHQISNNSGDGDLTSIDIAALIAKYGGVTPDSLLDFIEIISTHGSEAAGIRALAMSWLTEGLGGAWPPDEATLHQRTREVMGLYFRLPEFNRQ